MKNLKFYEFYQNNSGGWRDSRGALAHYVYIEAESAEDANKLALTIGIYFDGVAAGLDCKCCGDRWTPAREECDAFNVCIGICPHLLPNDITFVYADGTVKRLVLENNQSRKNEKH